VRDGAEVTFASGARRRADLVVAADGVDSTVRAREMPRVALRYAGYVGWRGMVDEGDLEPATMDALHDAITYFAAPGTHIVVYPIPDVDGALARGSRRVNYVWYRNVARGPALDALLTDASGVRRGTSLPPGAVAPRFVAELRAAAGATLPPQLAEVVTRTREPFVQTIADLECPRMALGRVALIGDAAFVARPHAAAGTAKACANAWALAPALGSGDGDVEGALARWEAGQLALGRALVRRAAVNGDRSQFGGGWTPGDRSLAFGLREPGDSEVV
jgi:2,6-dihydroxypyridine 3-monooxygenase